MGLAGPLSEACVPCAMSGLVGNCLPVELKSLAVAREELLGRVVRMNRGEGSSVVSDTIVASVGCLRGSTPPSSLSEHCM